MLLLKKGDGAEKLVYIIHDGLGEIISYMHLVHNMNKDYKVYGIDYTGKIEQESTLERLAEHYASHILKQGQCNDCILIGWSVGGTIAFEIATILEKQGSRVKLILIDSFLSRKYTSLWNKFMDACGYYKSLNYREITDVLDVLVKKYPTAKIRELPKVDREGLLVNQLFEEKYHEVLTCYQSLTMEELYKKLLIFSFFQERLFYYIPTKKLYCDVLFFIAKNNTLNSKKGWGKVLKGKTKYYTLNATHHSIIDPFSSREIVSYMNENIRQY